MGKSLKIMRVVLILYTLGVLWGQMRLPFVAVKNLSDYDLLMDKPVISASDKELQMLEIQKWYLQRSMKLPNGTEPPSISAEVIWNLGIIARVRSGHYISSQGAESIDGLYFCVFGAWIRVYTFSHTMA